MTVNLNNNALAIEKGGNLDQITTFLTTINSKIPTLGPKVSNGSISIAPATDAVFQVSGTFYQATQPVSLTTLPAGTNVLGDINNITGTISLPTNAATQTLQTDGNTLLGYINDKTPSLGITDETNSSPVVLPTSQITALTPPTSVGINGYLPDFANTQTFNIGNTPIAISATDLPLPNGAATESTLSSLNDRVGQTTTNTASISDLVLNPALDLNSIALLKAIAIYSRQTSANTQVWNAININDITTANTKTITVPSNTTYHVLFGNITVTTDSSVADRILKIEILDSLSNINFVLVSNVAQPTSELNNYSLSANDYKYIPGTNIIPIQLPISLVLSAGQAIRFSLINGSSGDQMDVNLQVGVR